MRDPSWILVLGEIAANGGSGSLLALRKLPPARHKAFTSTVSLSFRFDSADLDDVSARKQLTLFVMSDAYLSLDQQLSFHTRLRLPREEWTDATLEEL